MSKLDDISPVLQTIVMTKVILMGNESLSKIARLFLSQNMTTHDELEPIFPNRFSVKASIVVRG